MSFTNPSVIIIIVVAFAFYLIYSQNNQQKNILSTQQLSALKTQLGTTNSAQIACPNCDTNQANHLAQTMANPLVPQVGQMGQVGQIGQLGQSQQALQAQQTALLLQKMRTMQQQQQPTVTNVNIEQDTDPYSDPIKKQDLYSMYDPLTYPQFRLSRDILDKYNEYYEKTGTYPAFGQATQPLFDNPILNGILIKHCDENDPFTDNTPSSVPLFRVSSAKNTNRYFYYVLDQRYLSKVELKIPLDNVKINGIKYNNATYYGLPEIFDDDIIDCIPIYPGVKFKVLLYKTYHFP